MSLDSDIATQIRFGKQGSNYEEETFIYHRYGIVADLRLAHFSICHTAG